MGSNNSEWYSDSLATAPADVTLEQRTDYLMKGVELLLGLHRASAEVVVSVVCNIARYLNGASCEQTWTKRAKYVLCFPLAKYLRNELPPCPAPFAFEGRARGWVKARLNAFSRSNTHLWTSWFQLKRCTLQVSAQFVEQSYLEHRQQLTTAKPKGPLEDFITSRDDFRRLLDDLRGQIKEELDMSRVDLPVSTSACYEAARSKGGAARVLCNTAFGALDPDESDGYWFVGFDYHPVAFVAGELRYNVLLHRYAPVRSAAWADTLALHNSMLWSYTSCSCMIQAVLEPMKVRIISKGNAMPYHLARPIQRAMHDVLRRMDCFRLIGKKLSAGDVQDLLERSSPGEKWASGDFKASTDNLHWLYSFWIVSRLFGYASDCYDPICSPEEFNLIVAVLGPHKLYYPPAPGDTVARGPYEQADGQLMGSILSFPILCLANLGVYLASVDDRELSLREKLERVLINGDDILFTCEDWRYNWFGTLGASVGLSLSVGKSYLHGVYANVNSTSFHADIARHCESRIRLKAKEHAYQIDYLASGLFFGQHKVQGQLAAEHSKDSCAIDAGLGKVMQIILDGAWRRPCFVLGRWLTLRSGEIGRFPNGTTRSLHLAPSHGGYGVVPPVGWKWRISTHQRAYMHGALRQLSDQQFIDSAERPLRGDPIVSTPVGEPWNKKSITARDQVPRRSKQHFSGAAQRLCGLTIVLPPNTPVADGQQHFSGIWLPEHDDVVPEDPYRSEMVELWPYPELVANRLVGGGDLCGFSPYAKTCAANLTVAYVF